MHARPFNLIQKVQKKQHIVKTQDFFIMPSSTVLQVWVARKNGGRA